MDKYPNISVIIPTYNRKELLARALKSVFEQDYPAKSYEVIVADDGSKDGTREYVSSLKPKCKLVYAYQENQGRGKVRNFGVSHSTGEILAFTDDDCVASKGWLKNAAESFTSEKVGGVRGKTITDMRDITPLSRPIYSEGGDQTCNIFYRRKAFDEVGGFKLGQFREDTDLAFRVRDAGYEMPYNSRVEVKHPATRYTIKQLISKHLDLKRSYWDMYLAKKYPARFKKEIAISGIFNPTTFMNYPFYFSLAFSAAAFFTLSRGIFITSLVLLAYVYLTSVLIITNELCRATTFRQMAKHKNELLQLFSTWWIIMIADLYYHIKGMLRFRVFSL